ncbi:MULTISPECIES: o-succinylbenzoate--CoA ligase [unclassified Corynebacterium]|uniref:o-succinylbenzoate--CoA ligase n=1 Tax=unclassified Corynebacterium TaxID=2624378 RepID=UPI00216A0AFB|nr:MULTISPECIES: o-succinylbenzoate--CoA ligase [unclassified Corynebacterium]MCS4489702.1 o-succinylbenzoate--CoA ligase [Corynebacterium sp. ES2775-CONJ]MCS4491289.1 o-succinylbenzoate--CoA ligase [Corynebacterium sp. ES2715-CONJ3]
MSRSRLRAITVDPADPLPLMSSLEEALSGQMSILPCGPDLSQNEILRGHCRVGAPIDPEVAVVVATSGSTGTPKGAELTPANLISSADATHQYLGGEGAWLLAMPAHHIAGLQVLVRSIVSGYEPEFLDLSHGFSIQEFALKAERLAHFPGRIYTALTPMQLLKAMDTLAGIEALRLFHAVLVGGAPLRRSDYEAAGRLGITVVRTYGSSETSGGCVYDGRPLPGVTIQLRGERIAISGPMVARGYRNMSDSPAFFSPGSFLTSDTGFIDNGLLTVTGRIDTIIDSGGLKIHPEVIEQVIANIEGVSAVCVVGIPDRRLGEAIVAAYTGTASPATIIEAFDEMPRWQLPKQITRVESLPLKGPGKIDRLMVREKFMHDLG